MAFLVILHDFICGSGVWKTDFNKRFAYVAVCMYLHKES